MSLTYTKTLPGQWKSSALASTLQKPSPNYLPRFKPRYASQSCAPFIVIPLILYQIDQLNLEGYANLEHGVAELDKRIESILLQRLTHIVGVWCTEFDRDDDGDARRDPANPRDMTSRRRGEKRKDEKFLEGGLALKPIVHEIQIQNQVIFLDPPIEYARQTWLHQLHEWLGELTPHLRLGTGIYPFTRRCVPATSDTELAV